VLAVEMQMDHCALRPRITVRRLFFNASATGLLLMSAAALAETPAAPVAQLQPKPNRCVALHQGQVCYQDVMLSWSAVQPGEFCLYQKQADQPLHCWQAAASGQYRYSFASDGPVQLQLVNSETKTVVAETQVDVAWVYKTNTRRKTHWRLF
ncbi:MAG TPA: DUF3019 domain-containing protein, partial [Cellvibrio sp.]|nr:DUF3019 domain-containing protein [Cellvibrio sp.]